MRIYGVRLLHFILVGSFIFAAHTARAQEPPTLPILYPFVRDGKWGYINAEGTWVIEPRFDRCINMFEGKRVRVWQGKRWGYIDRAGRWIAEPKFTDPILGDDKAPFEVVSNGRKQGVLGQAGKIVLPAIYDDIVLSTDRAWVRRNGKLGLFALDGRWLFKLSLPWPKSRDMPVPTGNGAVWFKQGRKWGLLAADGTQLFPARFAEHVMGRKEFEEWTHPEGLDFKSGRAWVTEGEDYLLITGDGKVLARQPCIGVRPWADDSYIVITKNGQGLISKDGQMVLPISFLRIGELNDGLAVVTTQEVLRKPNGDAEPTTSYAYIDRQGHTVVQSGIYTGPGTYSGFANALPPDLRDRSPEDALQPFQEGLSPVHEAQRQATNPFTSAGYIDRTGAMAIPAQFRITTSFCDGLAAVLVKNGGNGRGDIYDLGAWGYTDHTGTLAVQPQFTFVSPFCRGRAWAAKGKEWDHAIWAMIDQTGSALTDFAYTPPERTNAWHYQQGDKVLQSRWRGSLAIVTQGDSLNGLATSEGKVLFPPIYNRIGEFHDGVAVAVDSRQHDGKGNITWITSLLTDTGETLATGVYTEVSDFEGGFAWASHRWTDHRGPYEHEGWGLIDTAAHERTDLKFVRVWWVWGKQETYTDSCRPLYTGDLAPVALAKGYQQYGKEGGPEVWERNSWGYINRAGKIIAWHDKPGGD